MGFLKRLRGGRRDVPKTRRELAAEEVRADAADEELVEIEVVGEGYRQDVLARLAGPKGPGRKHMSVGATFRCEPKIQQNARRDPCGCHGSASRLRRP